MENAMNCSSLPDNQTADFIERFFLLPITRFWKMIPAAMILSIMSM